MRWSQLKTRVESLLAESVRGRVGLHTTRYRKAHDSMGRAWITASLWADKIGDVAANTLTAPDAAKWLGHKLEQVSKATAAAVRDILVNVASEVVKQALFGP